MTVFTSLSGCSDPAEVSSGSVADKTGEPAYNGTIVAVGDSLTAGYGLDESQAYPAKLEALLAEARRPYKVINAGVSGETSSGTLSRIQWVIQTLKPDIVILETGANDGLRGIDPQVTRENIDKIITTLKGNGIVVVLAGMQIPPNLGADHTREFARLFPDLAERHNLIFIPFFLEDVAGIRRLNLPDGLHPTEQGYDEITKNVYPHVVKAIEMIES